MEVTRKPHLHQDWIDSHAYGIVKALQRGGFETYLVGGCVRDLLLNIHPKDYDIATMATPQQVKKLIYMAFIIGRRFRLVLVKRENQQFEVATFRREMTAEDLPPEGVEPDAVVGDNVFGTPEEDARRRDFTINALFYDPIEEKLIDYVEGLKDIEQRVLRMIGEPNKRLVEDSIRILRALRFAHKLGFAIDPELRAAMQTHAPELSKSVLPRRREEILKLLRLEKPELAFMEAYDLGILQHVIPGLHELLENKERCDRFLHYFEAFAPMAGPEADTLHLFGRLILAIYNTVNETRELSFEGAAEENANDATEKSETKRKQPDLLSIEDERFTHLMRDELGMFKFEILALEKAIGLESLLEKVDEVRRRGERRQIAILKNEGFPLALQIAQLDFRIAGEKLLFWKHLQEKLKHQLAIMDDEAQEKRRGTRRRRRRKKPYLSANGASPEASSTDSPDDALDDDVEVDIDDTEEIQRPT